MAVAAAQFLPHLPGMDPRLIEEHLSRLDERYFDRFSVEEITTHLERIGSLGREQAARLLLRTGADGRTECTAFAFDRPGAFSLIVGVLSSMGFDILSGDIFTWVPAQPGAPKNGDLRRRRIIDQFIGRIAGDAPAEEWEQRAGRILNEVFSLLEQGGDAETAARRMVNEMAARRLGQIRLSSGPVLYPVQIEVDDSPADRTRLRVISQDTPFFLFTFSTALSLQKVSIEHVTIRTEGGRIEDDFEIVDEAARKIEDRARIDRIKLSVLLTKQFTSFLESAPDPLAALLRFEQLVRDITAMPEQGRWVELLSDQGVLRDLAQILGASTFLWEDFVRLQYEALLPMLRPQTAGGSFCEPLELLPERLDLALQGAADAEDFVRRLNEFKDREIYLFDLDHILTPGSDFLTLSRRLTGLAELVVDAAAGFAWRSLSARHGEPRTVAGIPVRMAILGLGKLGGVALGYASDIELLFVYSDSGSTAGPQVIDNSEFFDSLVKEILGLVRAKREGIFHIDLRLRPFGAAGPLACSLESFCTYYAKDGKARSYERLALVRLRPVGGDRAFGGQIARLRDELVYTARSIDLSELRGIRARQVQEKSRPGAWNAKFSPGALVDLEYAVQVLQVEHGAAEARLRTPRIHEALEALASIGVLDPAEASLLLGSYRFFRTLINGLRMLRGSAQDLFLPAIDSDEFLHLARRMGYEAEDGMTPAQRLHLDFETHTAAVRAFVERHLGKDSLPGSPMATVADLVLAEEVPLDLAYATLREKGFDDPQRAFHNIRHIAGEVSPAGGTSAADTERRALFARLAILACDMLAQRPDPDMALNNWERFLHSVPDPQEHLRQMLSQPMRLEILLSIFSASQFLADTLVRDPAFLDYIGRPEIIHRERSAGEIASELSDISARTAGDRGAWLDAMRRFRRREILRIGARDICLAVHTQRIMEEISNLADGMVEAALARIRAELEGDGAPARFCVIAFGKLGGRELNYSSDIDLLGLCDGGEGQESVEEASALMERLRADLSTHTAEGYAYRVDLRLRPYGSSGQLVFPLSALTRYYTGPAAPWEIQALLKARTMAGDRELGAELLDSVRGLILAPHEHRAVAATIVRMRREALKGLSRSLLPTTDIKTGLGGLRDIEFLAQGLQMVHARAHPEILVGGTLPALAALGKAGILPAQTVEQLSGDYLFLRRMEHFLQIYEDRQTHSLPRDPSQLRALARSMLGSGASADELLSRLARRSQRVQEEFRRFVEGAEGSSPA